MGEHRPLAAGPWLLHHPQVMPGRNRAESLQTFPLTASKASCKQEVLHATSSGLECGSKGLTSIKQLPHAFQTGPWPPVSATCPGPWTHPSFPGTLLTLGKGSSSLSSLSLSQAVLKLLHLSFVDFWPCKYLLAKPKLLTVLFVWRRWIFRAAPLSFPKGSLSKGQLLPLPGFLSQLV